MAYQIPQQLAYKEKIMFGLTFKQLIYAFLFGSMSIILFKKINNLTLGFILGSIPSIIGLGFIFFNFEQKIKDYYIYLKFRELKLKRKDTKYSLFIKKIKTLCRKILRRKEPKEETNDIKKFFGIKEIKDNFIINSKNKKIAVLKVSTINFSMKPSNEKEAVIKSFQKFLNSLDFPTQILMNTESIKLEDYLTSLKSRINQDQFESLFNEYKSHLQNTIKTNKIMNRIFYLIIPEETDINIQIMICLERLASLNLKSKQLRTNELKKLLMDFFKGEGKNICKYCQSHSIPERSNNRCHWHEA